MIDKLMLLIVAISLISLDRRIITDPLFLFRKTETSQSAIVEFASKHWPALVALVIAAVYFFGEFLIEIFVLSISLVS